MNSEIKQRFPTSEVTDKFLPFEDNCSPEFARLEAERLWPYLWQIACRLEELPNVGDFVTYAIVDESIIVISTSPTAIKAYHTVYTHRCAPLPKGCEPRKMFQFRSHGWEL